MPIAQGKEYTGTESPTHVDALSGKGVSVLRESARVWMLVQNNPADYGVTYDSIASILQPYCDSGIIQFWAMIYEDSIEADENGKHTRHCHIVIYFPAKQRGGWLHKRFPHAALQPCAASVPSLIQYIKKDPAGAWYKSHPEKEAEKLPDQEAAYYQWGDLPQGKNKRTLANDAEIINAIKDGSSDTDILTLRPDLWKSIPAIRQTRAAYLYEKYRHAPRDVTCIYIEGATGTGKTRTIMERHQYELFSVDDYSHPWDGYEANDTVAFDEFRSSVPLKHMLRWLDIYPCRLPARYANAVACYTTIYLVSNWPLEAQYTTEQQTNPRDWMAFLRRIHQRRIYTAPGIYTDYIRGEKIGDWVPVLPSLEPDANRLPVGKEFQPSQLSCDDFVPLPDDMDCPF